jgi:hypothetical protein
MKSRIAYFLVPVLTAVILLYQVLSSPQSAMTRGATLLVIGTALVVAVAAGLLAAFGPPIARVGVLAVCALLFLDLIFGVSGVFDRLQPAARERTSRDTQRLADIHRIKAGLEQYVARHGALPMAKDYGEGTGPDTFWKDWWDVSSSDGNKNGTPFLDFLVDGGIMPSVPVDPVNEAMNNDPKNGKQYVYLLVPPNYDFAGGACDARPNRWHYMVAITDLEDEPARPPLKATGSGCQCLWRDQPNSFQQHFDYILCGSFDATPEVVARAAEARANRLDSVATAATRIYEPQDKRRVADIVKIQQGLEKYLDEIGPLPPPREYGEAEKSLNPGFWQGYWDVSTEDGDGDGRAFLDFLSESGVLPSVPVDPENTPGADGDPRGGRQYVYYLAPGDEKYQGGTCAPGQNNKWVYMLGITDLQSEVARPPRRIAGSGCDCLWRNQPNVFAQHFDYVVCGTFEATPQSRARAAATLAKRSAAAVDEKQAEAARIHGAEDQRRIADLLAIQKALQTYLKTVGPLPVPGSYGESEKSTGSGFWQHYWDVSAEDGDGDGKMFLDFLVDGGILPTVPVDPNNERAADGDPRGGKQYVYFVAPAGDKYQGGSCVAGKNQWVYMLGITDLKSEITRPPKKMSGSGCECLWRDQPNYFQQQFDYVVCGTFSK